VIGRKMNQFFNEALSIGVAALSKKVLSKKNFFKKASPIEAYSIEKGLPYRSLFYRSPKKKT